MQVPWLQRRKPIEGTQKIRVKASHIEDHKITKEDSKRGKNKVSTKKPENQ